MSWANNVLPRFIGVSGESEARRLPHRRFAVQIGDIKKTSECRSSTWFQAHGFRFNRTLLIYSPDAPDASARIAGRIAFHAGVSPPTISFFSTAFFAACYKSGTQI